MKNAFFLAMMLLFAVCPVQASAADYAVEIQNKTVRVGIYPQEGFHNIRDGKPVSGYGYDYLQHLRQYAPWKFEYTKIGMDWPEALKMLEDGEIDMLSNVRKTPDRETKFAFSKYPMGQSSTILTVRSGNTKYREGDYANWDGIRIGIPKSEAMEEQIATLSKQKGFHYTAVLYDGMEELLRDLQEGKKIDAALSNNLRQMRNEWILDRMNVTSFFIITRKDNPKLLAELNSAMEQLEINDPSLRAGMRAKYFTQRESDNVQYSEQEREFIRRMSLQGKKFVAVLNPDRYPLSYLKDGVPQGMFKDLADEIIRRTGLAIEFKVVRTPEEYRAECRNPTVDFVFDAKHNLSEGEEQGLILSRPYIALSAFLLMNRSCAAHPKRYVLIEGYRVADEFSSRLPKDAQIGYCKTTEEAVSLVASGKYDATCLHSAAAELAVRNDPMDRLEAVLLPKQHINLCVGTRDSRNPLLSAIMNRAVASISDDYTLEIARKYGTLPTETFLLARAAHRHPFIMFGIPLALLLVLCVFLFHMLRMRKNAYRLGVVFKNLPFRYFFADERGRLLQYDYGDAPDTPRIHTLDDMKDDSVRHTMKKMVTEAMTSGELQEDIYMDSGKTRNCVVAPVAKSLFGRRAVIGVSSDITELRNSRDAARKNEEFFRLTLQSIGDGVIATDAHGKIIILNPVAERMMGVKLADVIGKPHTDFFKIVNADDGRETESPVLRTLRTKRVVELANHTTLKSLDGTSEWQIADSSSPILDASGNIFGAILVFRDVTEEYARRKETEAELANWETVAEIAQIYHFKYNPETRKVKGSSRLPSVWPMRDGRAVPSEEWIYPDDLAEWKKQYSAVLTGRQREAIVEFRVKHEGKMRYFRSFMRGSATSYGGITGILQEVTKYLEAEAERKAFHELWSACLKNMPLVLFIKSPEDGFRYQQCNENYAEFLGRNSTGICGHTDDDLLFRKEDAVELHRNDMRALETKRPVKEHETVTDANGKVRHFLTVKFLAPGVHGKPVLVGMGLDETEEYNRTRMLNNMLEDWENVSNVAGIGSYRLDREMNILSATERMARFWPVGPDGKPIPAEECLLPDDVKEYNTIYAEVFSGKREDATMLCRVPRKEGMQYLRLYIKRNAERRDEISGLLHDVTVQKQEEQKREALLAMWKNVVNTVPALFFVKNADDDFRYLQVNDIFCEQIGLRPEDIVGHKEDEFVSDTADAERNMEEDLRTMKLGVRQNYVEQIHVKDGELRHYQTVKIPSVDEEGRRILIAMSQDITEAQELSESRKIISSAFETLFSSDDLVEDMRVILKNICEFIGFERAYIACVDETVNEVRVFATYRPADSIPMFDPDSYLIEHATSLPWYVRLCGLLHKNEYRFDFSDAHDLEAAKYHVPSILAKKEEFDIRGVHLNYISLKGKPWSCLGFVTCGHTLKKLSAHEENLLKLTAHTIELAITRKRTLDQLHGALNRALAADKAKTFFLSSMSHEIRTPLNAVIGFTDLLKDSDLDRETRDDYLTNVSEASHALLTLLNDILELSKLTSNKVQINPVMTDMNAFVKEMDTMFRPAAMLKHLTLDFFVSGVPLLFVDQPRLRQVLFNLIGNAIKFTKDGGVKVTLAFDGKDNDTGTLLIRVADTGIGILEEDREKMFEPFIQMSRMRGTNASGTGTGLGLAIVRKIVEQEGGALELQSEVGKGSTFTITIPNVWLHPREFAERKDEAEQESALSEKARQPVAGNVPRVLVVDDAAIALEIVSRMLTWMHVPHEKAVSARDALMKLEKEPYDILMTDLLMPEMTGAELAQTVRADSRYPRLRIIAMSTENESIMYDKKLFDKVMLKPIVRNALFDCIFGKS